MLSVILTKDVDNLGRAGEIVKVKPGYGRNFLLPRGLALVATRGNVAQLDHHRREIERDQARIRKEHEKTAATLKGTSVSIARKVGKDDKLFGSVSSRDIAEALAMQNLDIDRRAIQLPEPIRAVGQTEVNVKFSADVQVALKVTVVGIK
ncbi:MAG: 50S ribosomal protein L9 [Myxococcota bacterium]